MKRHTLALVTSFSLFGYGAEAQTCGVLCDEEFWKSASPAEVSAEISKVAVDARTEATLTALMAAVGLGTTANVDAVLGAVGDVNGRDENGFTALMSAAGFGTTESLTLLLDAGADVNARSNIGWTALLVAVVNDATENVKALLNAGAEVNVKGSLLGRNALMWAATGGTAEMVRLLLDAGADASAIDSLGDTAWDLAQGNYKLKGTDAFRVLNDALAPEPTQSVGPPLTFSELDGFRRAVSQCWNTGALDAAAQRVTVVIFAEMTEDGKPVSTSLRLLEASGGEGKAVTDAYEAARRAILRCGISGYDLPKEKYAQWREIEMTFNPGQMRIK